MTQCGELQDSIGKGSFPFLANRWIYSLLCGRIRRKILQTATSQQKMQQAHHKILRKCLFSKLCNA